MKTRNLKNALFASLVVVAACSFGSCSKSEKGEAEVTPQVEYVLREISYTMSDTDKIDTLTVELQDTTLFNTGNTPASLTFADHFPGLKKTSQFQISNPEVLPAGLKLEQFEVDVPSQWIRDNTFSYFSKKLPFSAQTVEVPYGGFGTDSVHVNVPARSKIVVRRSVQAHRINCSFTAVIQNTTKTQTFKINGKWNGILRYDNLNTALSEQPL